MNINIKHDNYSLISITTCNKVILDSSLSFIKFFLSLHVAFIMIKILLTFLLSIACLIASKVPVDVVFDNNNIMVQSPIINDNLAQKLNSKYIIDAKSIVDIGISPFSRLYMIDSDKNYYIDYNIISSYDIPNVFIYLDPLLEEKINFSEHMVMRGIDLAQITFYPFIYNSNTKVFTVIENFEIQILEEESHTQNFTESVSIPMSREYEKILEQVVVNLDLRDRVIDDLPSILYICGGSSLSNSYLQDLIQWRREQGFKVYTATTLDIGNSFNAIKDYIENAYFNWEYPPEYIVLVGDTGGSYAVSVASAGWGDTDYPYTLIDGNDLLPEMFIGRIPANSPADLDNIINKTLAYEKATFIELTGTEWYDTASLVGDPTSSGNSVVITNEFIENTLNIYEFDNIETCYSGCGYPSWMQSALNSGTLYFNYRGYLGNSGFSSSHINNANNNYMTPFATFITCATGDFGQTAIVEDFIRAGSTSNPKGAVAAVGTATTSTHTMPNNIIDMGIYHGIFVNKLRTAGGALVGGKMALYNTYSSDSNANGMIDDFTHWNNLMGDPVLNLWTDTPQSLTVNYPATINPGTNFVQVSVVDEFGSPISDVRVVLYSHESDVQFAFTDLDGIADIYFDFELSSSLVVTALKHNFIPFRNNILVSGSQDVQLAGESFYVDDSGNQNEDSSANPGETVDVYFLLENQTLGAIQNLAANVSTNSEKIDIITANFNIDEMPTLTPTMVGPATLFIHQDLISTDNTNLILTLTDGSASDWNFSLPLEIISPNAVIGNVQYSVLPIPGSTIGLNIDIENIGQEGLVGCYMNISASNSLIDIIDYQSFVGNIPSGGIGSNLETLSIELSENIIDGSVVNLMIQLYNDSGYTQDLVHNITVGTANQYDPLGPDEYGYYIYDWQDIGYTLTPFYDWIEIDPSQGGNGVDMGISDSGNGNGISNSTKYINLPFEFTFYGEDYDEVSVNANGWISFGYSQMESFRNYPLPGPGGPSPMVAAFWDDLKTNTSSKVFKYITNDYVVIEWLNMKTYESNSNQTFQIILYNTMTPTGDDEIKIQYKEFDNTTTGSYPTYHGCYSTVGIENHFGNIGLEYTFDNSYPLTASPLQDESAIFITTRNTTIITAGDINQDQEINVQDVVLIISEILNGDDYDLLDPVGQFAADVNNDEIISILDVIIVINMILDA